MALSVPLSRFTSRVGGGSAFYVRPHRVFGFYGIRFRCGVRVGSPIAMSKLPIVRLSLARAGFVRRASAAACRFISVWICLILLSYDVDVA